MAVPANIAVMVIVDIDSPPGRVAQCDETAVAAGELAALFDELRCRHAGVRLAEDDGERFVARFWRVTDALDFALDLQRAVADACARGTMPLVRMAVHAGDVRPGDVDAEASIATRCGHLLDLAHAGQALVTRVVRDLTIHQLADGIVLRDLGMARLRDLSPPERVYQLAHVRLPSEFPPLRSLDTLPTNLPIQRTSFVGRGAERTTVASLLAEGNRLVTLTGAGGCGKTRLALRVAAGVAPDYGGGVWWVDLARLADASLLPNAVAAALTIKEAPGERFLDTVARHLRHGPTLLVLDNCEHIVEVCAGFVDDLLGACPALSVLTTSREPIGVQGEISWRVPAMRLPGEDRSTAAVGQSEAVRLFVDRAAAVQPEFRIADENADIVAAICTRLDGIPLAIELAAARSRMMTVDQILSGLSDRFRLLTGGTRTAVPRHRTLRASVDWSYGLLSERERVVFRRLAVFVGGITLDAAEEVCSNGTIVPEELLEIITALVDRSLVQVGDRTRVARYHLLENLRQYANDRLIESGEVEVIRTRHLGFFLALGERAQPEMEGPRLFEWLQVLDAEHDNVRAALQWSAEVKASTAALRLTSALWLFWLVRGQLTEGKRRIELALQEALDARPSLRAWALVGLGQLMVLRGDLAEAAAVAREAQEIARALEDERLEGRALDTLAYSIAFQDPAAAPPLFEQSATLSRRAGDGPFVADALNGLGISYYLSGDYRSATTALEQGVACSRESDSPGTLMIGLAVLGYCLALEGRLARAQTCLRESLVTARRLRDRAFAAQSLFSLGFIEAQRGEHGHAEALLEESVTMAREASPLMLSFALLTHGIARYVAADVDGSRVRLEEGLALARTMALPWVISSSLALLGETARIRGDLRRARGYIDEALAVAKSKGLRTDLPIHTAARLAHESRDLATAESLHYEALEAASAAQSILLMPLHLEALAGLAGLAGRFREGARLFGAAEAARQAHGLARYTIDHQRYDADVARIANGLPADELRVAWDEGRAMSPEQAAGYVARGRGERKRPSFGWDSLTPTEVEVVRHIAQGLTNPEIARRLFVSRSTVKAHLAHIFGKLEVSTRSELAAQATRRGLSPRDVAEK
jgi:predicted ATPase/DNA-binding CsgD family transcriptional regulator